MTKRKMPERRSREPTGISAPKAVRELAKSLSRNCSKLRPIAGSHPIAHEARIGLHRESRIVYQLDKHGRHKLRLKTQLRGARIFVTVAPRAKASL